MAERPFTMAGDRVRAGSLLISSALLTDSPFARSVIYIIEHNPSGTLGVMINQMSHTAVHNLMPRWTDLAASPRAIFSGGPVKSDTALCLGVLARGLGPNDVPGVRLVDGRVVLVDLDDDPDDLERSLDGIRIFAGYCGWGMGQLDAELAHDSWLVVPSFAHDVLAPAHTDLFAAVLRRQPWPTPLLATLPTDVRRN